MMADRSSTLQPAVKRGGGPYFSLPPRIREDGMSKTILVIGAMVSAILLARMAAALSATPGGGKPRTVTLVGAGDIAGCDFKPDRKTQGFWAKYREPSSL